MEIVKDPASLSLILNEVREKNLSVGFVPTMGSLHSGHYSLIETAKNDSDFCVVSIFVNPTQFAPNEDLDKYPRNLADDTNLCKSLDVDILFLPEVEYLYGLDQSHSTTVSVKALNHVFEGATRPTHFDGVTTIMAKLLNIVGPSRCFMGMKDAQQISVVYSMVKELFMNNTIVPCPTIRDSSNLALSSRNVYLSDDEREDAKAIYVVLNTIASALEKGNANLEKIIEEGVITLRESNLKVEYLEFFDFESLIPVDDIREGQFVLALEVLCGTTRLLDNFFIHVDEDRKVYVDRGKVSEPI